MSIYLLSLELKEFTKLWNITMQRYQNQLGQLINLMSIKVHGNFLVPWA